jgi:dTDP-4-dehydrorhamnose reductase
MKKQPTVLILGITGMLGQTLFKVLSKDKGLEVFGTARNKSAKDLFPISLVKKIITDVHAENLDSLANLLSSIKPDVIINCIGVVKQRMSGNNVLDTIPINTLMPHQLANLTKKIKARLIHISTDCVFLGDKGNYKESNIPDSTDLYGQSKFLGEVKNLRHVLTIRTSIIGHELQSNHGLLEWFLSQNKSAPCYSNAIFSGSTTKELSCIIRDLILPNSDLWGLYHIGSEPISKYDLLNLIAKIYDKKIKVIEQPVPALDRSLNCDKFIQKTQYRIKDWKTLISQMRAFHLG